MSLFSIKGVKCSEQGDYSYAHSVLQSLSCLECSGLFLRDLANDIKNNGNYLLTNAVLELFNCLNNGQEGNSQKVLCCFNNSYIKHSSLIQTKNVLNSDPFHFLYFLLQFLHIENNKPRDNNYDKNFENQILQNQQDDSFMYKLFLNFFKQTQNSPISNNFFSIERNEHICPNCQHYYSYSMKNLFRISVENVINSRDLKNPLSKGKNINLEDCLNWYFGRHEIACRNCGNNIYKEKKLVIPANVLIFSFERNFHPNKGDIDFDTSIDVNQYISKSSSTAGYNLITNYTLKACISFNNKYYADCYININNNNFWFRYTNEYKKMLSSNKEIYDYEPQILIYELNNKFNNENNQSNSINYQINNQFDNTNNGFYNNNQFNSNNQQFNANNQQFNTNNQQFNANNQFNSNNQQFNSNNQQFNANNQFNSNNQQFNANNQINNGQVNNNNQFNNNYNINNYDQMNNNIQMNNIKNNEQLNFDQMNQGYIQ